ncbi:entericidin A/B family lipoprotein [Glaciimonas sp. Gout2]|nr:entericidin A/B family lipoprotein [Glaciimonas sp. Cout2]MEB0084465.1 entericidin A/B family lipoprotein [Glaciimonas sp. Gout2]
MKKIIALCLLAAISTSMAGCNTFHGFGQDVEHVGEKMQGK